MAAILIGTGVSKMVSQSLSSSIFDWGKAYSTKLKCFPKIWYSRVGALSDQVSYPIELERDNGDLHGAAFAKDAHLSQEKAKSELIERWAYVSYFQNDGIKAGLDLDNSSTGFAALPKKFDRESVRQGALCEAIERWVLNLIFYQQNIKLKKSKRLGKRTIFQTDIDYNNKKYYFTLVLKKYKKGFLSGAAVSLDKKNSFKSANYELLNHLHKVERWKTGEEERNKENLLEKRTHNYYEDEILAKKYLKKLSECTNNTYKLATIIFDQSLPGPWGNTYRVHRILLSDSESIYKGGATKMML